MDYLKGEHFNTIVKATLVGNMQAQPNDMMHYLKPSYFDVAAMLP